MYDIPMIRPVTDLRTNYGEISNMVRESAAPVYLTKNGRSDMVLMSTEAYRQLIDRYETELKLKEAELEAAQSGRSYDAGEVVANLRKRAGEIRDNGI